MQVFRTPIMQMLGSKPADWVKYAPESSTLSTLLQRFGVSTLYSKSLVKLQDELRKLRMVFA